MNKIIFLLTIIALVFAGSRTYTDAQQETQIKNDTLIVGGIYRILMSDGRDITGEITGSTDSTVSISVMNETYILYKDKIRAIGIPDIVTYDSNEDYYYNEFDVHKFKMIGSVLAGICIPTGSFGDQFSSGPGFQLSAYTLFNRSTGIGGELQYNSFHGYTYYNVYTYNYEKIENSSYNSWMLKFNFIFGNLNPEARIVFYGLAGLGLQLNSGGGYTYTSVYSNETYSYKDDSNSEAYFQYALGAGGFYKISEKIGINLEFQFNKISSDSFSYNSSNGINGFYSIKAGLMYTNF